MIIVCCTMYAAVLNYVHCILFTTQCTCEYKLNGKLCDKGLQIFSFNYLVLMPWQNGINFFQPAISCTLHFIHQICSQILDTYFPKKLSVCIMCIRVMDREREVTPPSVLSLSLHFTLPSFCSLNSTAQT